ncbi:hypothetical protein K8Z49_31765 [Actinomadura madurae]
MRAIDNDPFAKNGKKNRRRKNSDFKANLANNNRRNVRQMPTRQLNRGR